jgi:hypothetical protein
MGAETTRATELDEVISETRKTGTPNEAAKSGRASWMAPVPTLHRKKFVNMGKPWRPMMLETNRSPHGEAPERIVGSIPLSLGSTPAQYTRTGLVLNGELSTRHQVANLVGA